MKPGDLDLSTIIDPMTETLRDWARQFIAKEIHRQLNEPPSPRAIGLRMTDAELRERNRLRVAHGLGALPQPSSDKRHLRDRIDAIRARKP
jgi:hypothetical protein